MSLFRQSPVLVPTTNQTNQEELHQKAEKEKIKLSLYK